MASIEIYGLPASNYVRAVRMACEEKGAPYELKPFPPHSPEINAIHPFGKMPAMRHGDFTLCESKAIATYLDRVFDGPALLPSEPRALAKAEQWISMTNVDFDPFLLRTYGFAYIFPKTADKQPDRATIDAAVPKLKQQIAILDAAVAPSGYLAGDRFSFADINLMPILFYVKMFPEGADAIGGAKSLAAYYERNAQRPSFRNTIPPMPGR
jgi:glutathione S-transferase